MDWAQAMYGVTYGLMDTHDRGECPSATQQAMRRTVARLYTEWYYRRHSEDGHQCPMSLLQSPRLLIEYKR